MRAPDIDFRTGVHVTGVDVGKKQLTTADNDTIGYEKLIIATGARVRVPVYETMQSLNLGVIIVLVPPLPLRSHV